MKRYDSPHKALWTTDFFNSVFRRAFCSSKNQVLYLILNNAVTDSNLTRLLLRQKQNKNKNKTKKKQNIKKKTVKKNPHLG